MESCEAPNTPRRISAGTGRRVGMVLAVIVVLTGGVLWWMGFGSYLQERLEYAGRTATFSGSSESLKQTVIVPTLDSPLPVGKNVIWCSSFQLAWNEVRDEVIGAPLEVIGAEEVAARLNVAPQSVSDLDEESVYAAGGWVEKGIREKIRREMATKFPSHVLPDFNDHDGGIVAYSYIKAKVPFKYPFRQLEEGLIFEDSAGNKTQVAGFGLWEAHRSRYERIRAQVEVLYAEEKGRDSSWTVEEYALDLCKHSEPYRVVAARVAPRSSLAETLEYVRLRTQEFRGRTDSETAKCLGEYDEVRVPEMFWEIDHRFQELVGQVVKNVGWPIVEARQTVEFRLDRNGAILETGAWLAVKAETRFFEFDRPFLVYMQKRGAAHPFFVMWVDNAELLVRK